jgi:hypothetical protein
MHIEEILNDICKRLYQRSHQPGHQVHSRWEKEKNAATNYEGSNRKNKLRGFRSSFRRRSNSKSKRRRMTRSGRR